MAVTEHCGDYDNPHPGHTLYWKGGVEYWCPGTQGMGRDK